jgi:hypothetical protein
MTKITKVVENSQLRLETSAPGIHNANINSHPPAILLTMSAWTIASSLAF